MSALVSRELVKSIGAARWSLRVMLELGRKEGGHSAGIRDGNGLMFISRDGAISPSGFLPLAAGNAKLENPLRIPRESELFRALRNVDGFHGRCGVCEHRAVCGGSRARAFTASRDVVGEDPLCVHVAPGFSG